MSAKPSLLGSVIRKESTALAMPFEGAGAISRWHLELPTEVRQFEYDTISDAEH